MTFTEAAALVLRLVGKPLHYKEITDVAIERSLLSHVGKSPEVTMGARLAAQVKKLEKDNPLTRVKPGVFALAEWDEKFIEDGLADRTPALERLKKADAARALEPATNDDEDEGEDDGEGEDLSSSSTFKAAPMAAHREIDESSAPDEDEQHRAELSAGATELFESEDDDDQPIFGVRETTSSSGSSESDSEDGSDRKPRRRRRRGRGRRDEEGTSDEGGDDLPTYTVSDAEPEDLPFTEEAAPEISTGDAEPRASLVSAVEVALEKYERSKGAVPAQTIADAMRRNLKADASLNAAAVISIALADNLAAERRGTPPKFRLAGGKIAMTAWSLDRRAVEKYRAIVRATDQVRETAVRAVADELKKLSQRAMGELVLVLLDRMGMTEVGPIRRPGAHGSEMHLAGVITAGGAVRIPAAVMVRRDGKDIGRERVTELRGAMHHYNQSAHGWIISTGQVLSGAREEAQSPGGSPVTLTGRNELAELCVTHGVGVRTHRVEIPVLDVELFENFQGR